MNLESGTRIAQHEVLRPIGAGAMGVVFLGRDTVLGRDVALKVLSPKLTEDPGWSARFLKEARVLASLHHPHIALVIGLEDGPAGESVLVMEFIEGESLAARLARGPLPRARALAVCAQIADALAAAHEKGIIHRDLKPGNVMLRADGVAKVLDFGLATSSGGGLLEDVDTPLEPAAPEAVTGEGETVIATQGTATVSGTPGYMSPEQAQGLRQDERTDVFAFGCVLFECLTGRMAFQAKSLQQVLRLVLTGSPDWGLLPPGLPAELHTLLRSCLERDLDRRQHDMGAVLAILREVLASPSLLSAPRAPEPRGPMLGREREVEDLVAALASHRLVTLTGPAGVGKTRLALALAHDPRIAAGDGVWFVDLSDVPSSGSVPAAVAELFGMPPLAPGGPLRALRGHSAGRDVLWVLDGCDTVLEGASHLADVLLADAPRARILATSREPLGLDGERVMRVTPFPVPPPQAEKDPASLASTPAVAWFLDRARAVAADFTLDADNAATLTQIIRRLDGLPLAIELAAGRLGRLTPRELLEMIAVNLDGLAGTTCSGARRHRSLAAALAPSMATLSAEEAALLRRIAVLTGEWSLEDALRTEGPELDDLDLLDSLSRLVDRSLLLVEHPAAGPSYRMLDVVRRHLPTA